MPNFTTTTTKDKIISKACLMGTMKEYFSYRCAMSCELPEVTLMGTLADWKLLKTKVTELQDYGVKFKDSQIENWGK